MHSHFIRAQSSCLLSAEEADQVFEIAARDSGGPGRLLLGFKLADQLRNQFAASISEFDIELFSDLILSNLIHHPHRFLSLITTHSRSRSHRSINPIRSTHYRRFPSLRRS
ncbi:hypothetical protein MJO28_013034 [Puccinia striiformis f. sp. tritici]|uniref:Uncharacterized protein n=1 Tax=Puccinia striiformis f. sp. tritici TaxID=168172 RepID=A0ACC0DXF9_9BASI|nr:hypothetical protein MJO28_013034 [Puccinia striiformis f. sp. tritici]KAI7943192.1 hypothetical protein MJO29_013036 [Puccinia striiformis f. sp. tritici]